MRRGHCAIFFVLRHDALGFYMGRFLGFCFYVGLLAHGKFIGHILYEISMVGVSLGFDGLGRTRFFVVGLCNGEMQFEMLPRFFWRPVLDSIFRRRRQRWMH